MEHRVNKHYDGPRVPAHKKSKRMVDRVWKDVTREHTVLPLIFKYAMANLAETPDGRFSRETITMEHVWNKPPA